jgi:hypothetical protein
MKVKLILIFLAFLLLPSLACARIPSGLGAVANNLMDPVSVMTSFVIDGSQIAGIAFLFGAFIRYTKYRVNQLESPLSTVIVLFVIGLVLLGIPLVHKLL